MSSHVKLKQGGILYALFFETSLYPLAKYVVFCFVLHLQASDAGEAVSAYQQKPVQESISEREIGSCHSWPSVSIQSFFCYKRALGPTVAFNIPGHLVLLFKPRPGTPCIPGSPGNVPSSVTVDWCLCSVPRLFSLSGMPCSATTFHLSGLFQRSLP